MFREVPVRLVIAGLLAVLILSAGILSGAGLSDLADTMRAALRWAQALRGVGWIAFAMLQILVVASGVLPASLAGMGAGAVYGVAPGFCLAAASTMTGAMVTLAISRSLARSWIERFMRRRPRLRDLDRLLAQDGIRLVCLLRLSPIMPFAATSYALGLSSVSVRDYIVGTCASLPALLGYVFLGRIASAGLAAGDAGWLRLAMLGVAAVATIALTWRIGQLLLRARLVPESLRSAANNLGWTVTPERTSRPVQAEAELSPPTPTGAPNSISAEKPVDRRVGIVEE
jgi:uncharacterized membrane protein YdjX (TVP38/TMEM64 family)